MRAIPERLRDALCGGAIKIDYLYLAHTENTGLFLAGASAAPANLVDAVAAPRHGVAATGRSKRPHLAPRPLPVIHPPRV